MTEPLKYETRNPNAYKWTDDAFQLLNKKKLHARLIDQAGVTIAEASGECPRCHDDVSFTMELDAPLPGTTRGLGEPSLAAPSRTMEYVPFDVVCHCRGNHPGRPDGVEKGCGIIFRVEVLRP